MTPEECRARGGHHWAPQVIGERNRCTRCGYEGLVYEGHGMIDHGSTLDAEWRANPTTVWLQHEGRTGWQIRHPADPHECDLPGQPRRGDVVMCERCRAVWRARPRTERIQPGRIVTGDAVKLRDGSWSVLRWEWRRVRLFAWWWRRGDPNEVGSSW